MIIRAFLFSLLFIPFVLLGDRALHMSLIAVLLLYLFAVMRNVSVNLMLNYVGIGISLALISLITNVAIFLAAFVLLMSLILIILINLNKYFFIQIVLSLLIYILLFS